MFSVLLVIRHSVSCVSVITVTNMADVLVVAGLVLIAAVLRGFFLLPSSY